MTDKQKRNAYAIAQGACNPRGVARTLVESIDLDTADGMGRDTTSPATRLILDQLTFLLTGGTVYMGDGWTADYHAIARDCEPEHDARTIRNTAA